MTSTEVLFLIHDCISVSKQNVCFGVKELREGGKDNEHVKRAETGDFISLFPLPPSLSFSERRSSTRILSSH